MLQWFARPVLFMFYTLYSAFFISLTDSIIMLTGLGNLLYWRGFQGGRCELKCANNDGVYSVLVLRSRGGFMVKLSTSDVHHQGKSGTGSLFLFIIKYLIICVSGYLVFMDNFMLGNYSVVSAFSQI